ncbi:elongation factor P maturation arginine rhamnosyltransferase EarP [Noviherbaspirillum sp. CPCC 100848]|uniref:Protein-arginine rhamnosyltransferase n=1 Tax=Noviherbaspirillum album TaxID=3080276 RepID=A0ABU6JGC9_9BURK|nr:elongation factor P maturation arginine rhamnosyltransferase EarP [Noviherbaspirillum sp. CPCC 100848]MEC4722159.1 elongation factor P maturation arginine rhamnosyltransferase EarP [Noviherbaspirillum sp. CPCC 100848]
MQKPFDNTNPASLALFCKVVDNFGDIGICWRLARQLMQECGIAVTLWVDDLHSFHRICPAVIIDARLQRIDGVTIRRWDAQDGAFSKDEIADIVIEFFACDIPPGYIAAMAECDPRPVWINLEGLSAEEWVEGCHTLPSPHPRLPLTKYFFFPGFTGKTGGLLHESALEEQRQRFQTNPAITSDFLARLGLASEEIGALKATLFCYPHAPVPQLFDAWRSGDAPITCLVPEGVAIEAVENFLGGPAKPGTASTRDALTIRILPFLPQSDYDKLLWACDLNFVRGEDSFVRAQWAGRPFVWHIYPQDKNLHHKKLRAFLQRYEPGIGADSLSEFALRWNDAWIADGGGTEDWSRLWQRFKDDMPAIVRNAGDWRQAMLAHGDLASNLMKFVRSIKSVAEQKKV